MMGGVELTGTYITTRQGKLVVKLDSGYNIGVEPQAVSVRETIAPAKLHPLPISQPPGLPELAIISTGGTIASRIDYRTGAVTSQFSAEDILRAVPRLGDLARFRAHQIATMLSENMTPAIWEELAGRIHDELQEGVPGVIVTHGTDTMSYTAAAVSFMVQTPVPVVFVGSQRSADRPSSDNVMNALCSASAALSDLGEVAVVMHGTTSDDFCAIHRATRVRKMHTSRRDAFRSVGIPPIGRVVYPSLEVSLESEAVRRDTRPLAFRGGLEDRVGFLFFYPGISPEIIASFEGYRGLVVAGSGLGHVSTACIPALEALIDSGTHVVMTSQCLHGRVCDRVYDTGRDLLSIGVIEGEDMLPETAMVKLMWVLAREDGPGRVRDLMQTDFAGEIRRCSAHGL
jgi:glutamyl-tRNA(Gln) amidotransferase subunit D